MKWIGIALAVIACAVGLNAALLWRRAAKIEAVPLWAQLDTCEPTDQSQAQAEWLCGVLEAARLSNALNKRAAIWTAFAVLLSTSASLLSSLT